VDLTGNTHRAEFCIDKLYSPDTATGRLGLLELRGFEMPPHARMSLTQQLLVRALMPGSGTRLIRKLPSRGDATARPLHAAAFHEPRLGDVLADLKGAGYVFDANGLRRNLSFDIRR